MERTQIDPKEIDAVYMGSAKGDARCPNLARYTSLLAGLPYEASAASVEMQCGSAIACINHAAYRIMADDADTVIVGGAETFSQLFFKFPTSQEPYKMTPPTPYANNLAPKEEDNLVMIQVADLMAKKWGITREDCDAFAYRSQMRAAAAVQKGYFKEEIVPVVIPATKKTPEIVFDQDEHLRPNTTMEALAGLRLVRNAPNSVTTAGNASGLNDGAAFVMMMSAEKAKELGYEPFARWVVGTDIGVEPRLMGIGPAYSNLMAIQRAGLTVDDIDVFECNEAFAAQNLGVIKEMEIQSGKTIDQEKWNPNGGAIAFGHPNGASGARIGIFCMKELARNGGRYGLFSSCCGGGQGVTTLIENLRK
jgi:acetyl-CoA C-acetyltransferase